MTILKPFAWIALALTATPATAVPFQTTNLAATDAKYGAPIVDPTLIDAWGLAIRPAGLGGHFWVTANGSGQSAEYVGDVGGSPLYQDGLKTVSVPGTGNARGTQTGVVFNGSANFIITQAHPNGAITNSAKFLFASTDGTLSAWTERNKGGGNFDRPGTALTVVDQSANGSQFFGLGISSTGDKIYAADFGATTGVRTYSGNFTDLTATNTFTNPFGSNYGTFNAQDFKLGGSNSVFVTYAEQGAPGSEIHGAGLGHLARYDEAGNLLAIANDKGLLNSPWGLAVAPVGFGDYGGDLLVGNFGDGTIVAFDPVSLNAIDYLRNDNGGLLTIDGLWGLVFGNGASLGSADALYFAAGPESETQGVFGRITAVPEPSSLIILLTGIAFLGLTAKYRYRWWRHWFLGDLCADSILH